MEMVRKDQTATNHFTMYCALLLMGMHPATGHSHASHTRRWVLVALLHIVTVRLEAFNAATLTMRLGLGSMQQRLLLCTMQLT